jgi:hypothetical protein
VVVKTAPQKKAQQPDSGTAERTKGESTGGGRLTVEGKLAVGMWNCSAGSSLEVVPEEVDTLYRQTGTVGAVGGARGERSLVLNMGL